jgi:hypothetical protein
MVIDKRAGIVGEWPDGQMASISTVAMKLADHRRAPRGALTVSEILSGAGTANAIAAMNIAVLLMGLVPRC